MVRGDWGVRVRGDGLGLWGSDDEVHEGGKQWLRISWGVARALASVGFIFQGTVL